jgi:hypothetical protein
VPRSGLTRKTPEYVRSHCSRGSGLLLGSLNVDRAVGFHDDVFQPVEAPALEAVGNITVMLPSASWRVMRRESCSQSSSRPCRSRVRPLARLAGSVKTEEP